MHLRYHHCFHNAEITLCSDSNFYSAFICIFVTHRSAEPPATLGQLDGTVSQSSLFPESLFASLESQWGDNVLTEMLQKTDTGYQPSRESAHFTHYDVQSRTTNYPLGAMNSTMSGTAPPPGIITRGEYAVEPGAKFKKQSNELGSELQEDRYCQLRGSLTRRPTLELDLETTYLDDQLLGLPPPVEEVPEDPLQTKEALDGSFPILSPPDKFRSKAEVQSTALPPTSQTFFSPVSSTGLNAGAITHLDVPPCEVAVLHHGTATDIG